MSIRVGINGFGRIGRQVFRASYEPQNRSLFKIVHINNLSPPDLCAHLLRYDSVHGTFLSTIEVEPSTLEAGGAQGSDQQWRVGGDDITWSHHRDPQNIPWKDCGVDVVMECTGAFTRGGAWKAHLGDGGAQRVLLSAPAEQVDRTVVYGVNDHQIQGNEKAISNASCTTNCLAVVAKVMVDHFDIHRGAFTTVHAYTSDQRLLDSAHKDWRRARAAGQSMIPTTTGAACNVAEVLPSLAGKLHGLAVRVPVANVSLTDVVWELGASVTAEEVNEKIHAASCGKLDGVLGYSTEPLVSSDYCGSTHSAVLDSQLTSVVDGRLCKMVIWYDNEVAFSHRMLDVARRWYDHDDL